MGDALTVWVRETEREHDAVQVRVGARVSERVRVGEREGVRVVVNEVPVVVRVSVTVCETLQVRVQE